ncbi:MAG: LacI family DNA-binding transcriptional regulator [Bacteroidetes bacterium]|nr:LacI family DNA-binding transcriptional regulator [Bacteroidota bacterium]
MERSELKAKVPHGYGKKIANKAGVTKQAVSQFLNGKNDNVDIEIATLEVLAELSEKKNNLLARIS